MRCLYCETPVFGDESVTIPGLGPAHEVCLDFERSSQRVVMGINLKDLSIDELDEIIKAAESEKQEKNLRGFDN